MFSACSSSKNIERLFENSEEISERKFSYEQIDTLPKPVKNYFKKVLQEGQDYISYVRLKHGGKFCTAPDKDPIDIKGEQYFTSETPGFVWIGKTSMFKAVDHYVNGKGKLKVKVFSLIPVANSEGFETDQGELLRWLGESVWFPTNFLPREGLSWSAIDDSTAKLEYSFKNQNIYYIVRFDENYLIRELETERYMGDKGLTKWIGKLDNYKKTNNIIIPHSIQANWLIEGKEFKYADFLIERIEYDIPEKMD